MSLQHRRRQPELMDDLSLDDLLHSSALTGLRRVNWWSRTTATLESSIRSHCAKLLSQYAVESRPLKILDIASGGGDLAIQLANRLRRSGISVAIEECDISSTAGAG